MQTILKDSTKASNKPFPKLQISTTGSGNVYFMESPRKGVCVYAGDVDPFAYKFGDKSSTLDAPRLKDFLGSITLMNGPEEAEGDVYPRITRSDVNGIIYLKLAYDEGVILKPGFRDGVISSTPGVKLRPGNGETYNNPVTLTQE